MPGAGSSSSSSSSSSSGVNVERSCQDLCRTLVTRNGLEKEPTDISQSVLYTSLMGLLLVTDTRKEELSFGSGRVGLRNIGNTCFLNAIVQCLSHTCDLRDYCLLKSHRRDKFSKDEARLTEAFCQVLSCLWSEDDCGGDVNPRRFYNLFREAVPHFSGYSQQDAQEFLRFLLDKLHTEINRRPYVRRSVKEPEQKYARFRISEEAAAMWKKHLEKDDSRIVDLFSGQLRSSLHCSVCSHYSNTFDVFCDLSLPIPKSRSQVTLKECLDLFSQEERLDKDNSPVSGHGSQGPAGGVMACVADVRALRPSHREHQASVAAEVPSRHRPPPEPLHHVPLVHQQERRARVLPCRRPGPGPVRTRRLRRRVVRPVRRVQPRGDGEHGSLHGVLLRRPRLVLLQRLQRDSGVSEPAAEQSGLRALLPAQQRHQQGISHAELTVATGSEARRHKGACLVIRINDIFTTTIFLR